MTSSSWSNEKTINFIDAVRLRVCLWDYKSLDYKNRNLKRDEWTAVGLEYQITQEEAAKKFKNLRTYFNSELKRLEKKQKGCSGASQDSTWFAFKSMLFLKGTDDVDIGIDAETQSEQTEYSDDDTIRSSPQLPPPVASLGGIKRKKTCEEEQYDNTSKVMDKVREKLSKKSLAFGDHVNQKLSNYSEHVRNQVEYKISTILYEADMGCYD